jgi:hypothetical protein
MYRNRYYNGDTLESMMVARGGMKPRYGKLNEMLGPVNAGVAFRRLRAFLSERYPECDGDIQKVFSFLDQSASDRFRDDYQGISICVYSKDMPKLYAKMAGDKSLLDDVEDYLGRFGYSFGPGTGDFECAKGRYMGISMLQQRMEPGALGEGVFGNVYIRWSNKTPEEIGRVGLRRMGHFYCYKLGRELNIYKKVCEEYGIPCDDMTLLEKYLAYIYNENCGENSVYAKYIENVDNHVYDERDKENGYSEYRAAISHWPNWGRYLYLFRYDGNVKLDPMDSEWFPDDDDEGLIEQILDRCDDLDIGRDSSIEDVFNAVHFSEGVLSPVMCYENIPPERILFLWDEYSENCDNAGIDGKYYEERDNIWKRGGFGAVRRLLGI